MAIDYAGIAGNTATGLYSFLIWGGLFLLVSGFISFIVVYFAHNWNVTLRYKTNTFDQIVFVKGRIKGGKNKKFVALQGGIFSLLKKKIVAPVPEPRAIGLTKNGSKCCELEVDENSDTRWIIRTEATRLFQPVDTDDREFYMNEMREAEIRKNKSWQEVLMMATPILAILIIFVLSLVYWEDVMKPAVQFAESNADIAKMQQDIVQKQREITLLQYRLLGEDVPVDAPPDAAGSPP